MKKTENDVILLLNPNPFKEDEAHEIRNLRRVQVLLVKNEKEHAWAINSRNID